MVKKSLKREGKCSRWIDLWTVRQAWIFRKWLTSWTGKKQTKTFYFYFKVDANPSNSTLVDLNVPAWERKWPLGSHTANSGGVPGNVLRGKGKGSTHELNAPKRSQSSPLRTRSLARTATNWSYSIPPPVWNSFHRALKVSSSNSNSARQRTERSLQTVKTCVPWILAWLPRAEMAIFSCLCVTEGGTLLS